MNYSHSMYGISLFCCSFSAVFTDADADADAEFSKIEEEMLLNPPGSASTSDKVMIYSRVRNKTIHQAMDSQFERIEKMMFVNTIVESETGTLSHADDDECD